MDLPVQFTITLPKEAKLLRLDAALAQGFPDLSLRARRRLWEWCTVFVDGKPRAQAYKVSDGDHIFVQPIKENTGKEALARAEQLESECGEGEQQKKGQKSGKPFEGKKVQEQLLVPLLTAVQNISHVDNVQRNNLQIRIVQTGDDFTFLFKPSGMHTSALAGSNTISVEGVLPDFWKKHGVGAVPTLLTRLDKETSGLIVAAHTPQSKEKFRLLERQGKLSKRYCAIVEGVLPYQSIKNALDTSNRKNTRVLLTEGTPERWTKVYSVSVMEYAPGKNNHGIEQQLATLFSLSSSTEKNKTIEPIVNGFHPINARKIVELGDSTVQTPSYSLVAATIYRGARHQIRVHLAHVMHPLVGDVVYGGTADTSSFYLHHGQIEFEGRCISVLPDMQMWSVWKSI